MNATAVTLNTWQTEQAERIFQTLLEAAESDLRTIVELLASPPDGQLLGRTEFEVRDLIRAPGGGDAVAQPNDSRIIPLRNL
jgi:hypothetical protein